MCLTINCVSILYKKQILEKFIKIVVKTNLPVSLSMSYGFDLLFERFICATMG